MMRGTGAVWRLPAGLLALLLWVDGVTAEVDARYVEKGIYAPVEPKNRNERTMLENCDALERQLARHGLVYSDPDLDDLLRSVAGRLVEPPEDDYVHYRFNVLRNPVPNAFALPDGQIYVHSGMLARLGSEAELAGLLGHEINHVRGHHAIVGMRSRTNKQIAGTIAGVALSIGLSAAGYGSAGTDLANTMNTLLVASMYSHSRTLEEEADRLAVERMVEAGYDPRALPELFELLMEDRDGLDPNGATIWATHPAPALRVRNLREQISRDYRPADLEGLRVSSAAFEARRLELAVLTISDYVAIEQPRTALRLGQRLAERYPERADIQVAIGDAFLALGPFGSEQDEFSERDKRRNVRERYRKTRAERWDEALATAEGKAHLERNTGQALAAYERARELDSERADVERGVGDALYLQNDLRGAGRHYVSYLKRSPGALDRERVLERLREIRDRLKGKEDQNAEG